MIGLLLLLQATQAVPPAPIRVAFYQETITLQAVGGRAISLEVRLRGAGTASLPLAWIPPDSSPFTVSPDVHAVVVRGPGTPRVELRSETPEGTVRMAYRDARGPDVRYRLVNGTGTEIDTFRLEVVLSPGTVPADIRYNVPAADSAPARHVLQLQRVDHERTVRLNVGFLAAGDIVELSVGIDRERKSPVPLVAGALLGLAFLIRRRVSLRSRPNEP